jgi:AcrR family transcriptional regulator
MQRQCEPQEAPDPLQQALGLSPGFSFAQFRSRSPLNADSVWHVLLERHQQRLTVKRLDKAQDNLRRLFEATFRLANKVGFASMTLRDLSQETGLSMGGLYGYISSKDDIAAMIEDMVRLFIQASAHWFTDLPDPQQRLVATLRGHAFMTEQLQPWFYFVFMESRMLSESQRQIAKSAELQFHDNLCASLQAVGLSHSAQAQTLAIHSAALLQDWVVKRWKYRQLHITVETFADDVAALVQARACQLATLGTP